MDYQKAWNELKALIRQESEMAEKEACSKEGSKFFSGKLSAYDSIEDFMETKEEEVDLNAD